MSTPYENADLLIRLYDLRREAKLRDARTGERIRPRSANRRSFNRPVTFIV